MKSQKYHLNLDEDFMTEEIPLHHSIIHSIAWQGSYKQLKGNISSCGTKLEYKISDNTPNGKAMSSTTVQVYQFLFSCFLIGQNFKKVFI